MKLLAILFLSVLFAPAVFADDRAQEILKQAREAIGGEQRLQKAQAFNLLNHANLGAFSGVQTSPFFGQATSAQSPRRVELGLRMNF